jgi:hypothetical protein
MMRRKFQPMRGLLLLLTTMGFPAIAVAQTQTLNYETPNQVLERAFFKNAPNFYGSQTFKSQVNVIFGPGSIFRNSFPEHEIARDGELVHAIYRDLLNQQATNDTFLRTPDLPNPYDSSLLMSPRVNTNKLKVGTEFRFETTPPR